MLTAVSLTWQHKSSPNQPTKTHTLKLSILMEHIQLIFRISIGDLLCISTRGFYKCIRPPQGCKTEFINSVSFNHSRSNSSRSRMKVQSRVNKLPEVVASLWCCCLFLSSLVTTFISLTPAPSKLHTACIFAMERHTPLRLLSSSYVYSPWCYLGALKVSSKYPHLHKMFRHLPSTIRDIFPPLPERRVLWTCSSLRVKWQLGLLMVPSDPLPPLFLKTNYGSVHNGSENTLNKVPRRLRFPLKGTG